MTDALIARYQIGGDIYKSFLEKYGQAGAATIAAAALSGDEKEINAAIVRVKFGSQLDPSMLDAFGNQIYNDPLGATLDQAATVLSNTTDSANAAAKKVIGNLFANPLVLLALIAAGLGCVFYFIGNPFKKRA